jgi:hypothetical protein
MFIDEKTRTKELRSTRDTDNENKPRPSSDGFALSWCLSRCELCLKSIRSDEDECPMPDATTDKLFLPTLRTIMKGREDETCPQC